MSVCLSLFIIGINMYLVVGTIQDYHLHWSILGLIGFISVFYILFCAYLIVHMIICMGNTKLLQFECIQNYVAPPDYTLET